MMSLELLRILRLIVGMRISMDIWHNRAQEVTHDNDREVQSDSVQWDSKVLEVSL